LTEFNQRYEYKVISPGFYPEDRLSELGLLGWELVPVVQDWVNHISPTSTYFKYYGSAKLEGRRDFGGDAPHPTIKPRELIERYIRISGNAGSVVFDPFTGSGTTLVACENLSRRARCIEIDPGYAAVTLQRAADIGLHPELIQ
jgi:hypothetical protein